MGGARLASPGTGVHRRAVRGERGAALGCVALLRRPRRNGLRQPRRGDTRSWSRRIGRLSLRTATARGRRSGSGAALVCARHVGDRGDHDIDVAVSPAVRPVADAGDMSWVGAKSAGFRMPREKSVVGSLGRRCGTRATPGVAGSRRWPPTARGSSGPRARSPSTRVHHRRYGGASRRALSRVRGARQSPGSVASGQATGGSPFVRTTPSICHEPSSSTRV